MLPSEFPEVQSRNALKRLLAVHVDMQFKDLRTMLRLPLPGLDGGCNFAAAAFLFNVIAGGSVCFYNTSDQAFKTRGDRSERFRNVLRDFYPWAGEPLAKEEAVQLLYAAARNPLAHSLGLDAPPTPGHVSQEIALGKRSLTDLQITELEDSAVRPAWLLPTITKMKAESGADKFIISVPALYWGVHRMLRALFMEENQVGNADAVAKRFGPLWDKYISLGETMTVSDAGGVSCGIERDVEGQ